MAYYRDARAVKLRHTEPVAVQNVLTKAFKHYGIEQDLARYQFVLRWKEIVGEQIARKTKPKCMRNGTLVVQVCNSVWAQELSFQKQVILKRLKKFTRAGEVVDDVCFYVEGNRS